MLRVKENGRVLRATRAYLRIVGRGIPLMFKFFRPRFTGAFKRGRQLPPQLLGQTPAGLWSQHGGWTP
jgi:hypothetical protein